MFTVSLMGGSPVCLIHFRALQLIEENTSFFLRVVSSRVNTLKYFGEWSKKCLGQYSGGEDMDSRGQGGCCDFLCGCL